jgi:hypothetical protein
LATSILTSPPRCARRRVRGTAVFTGELASSLTRSAYGCHAVVRRSPPAKPSSRSAAAGAVRSCRAGMRPRLRLPGVEPGVGVDDVAHHPVPHDVRAGQIQWTSSSPSRMSHHLQPRRVLPGRSICVTSPVTTILLPARGG